MTSQQTDNVITTLAFGCMKVFVEPTVAITLLQCFVLVVKTFCLNQPKTNVVL